MKGFESTRLKSVQEYYFSKKLKEIKEMEGNGTKILNLGIGSPDLLPPPNVIKTLQNNANEINANQYSSYQGIPELRLAFSNWYDRIYNVKLNPNKNILPLIGSKEGIMHISMAFLNRGDTVLIPSIGYPTYTSVSNLLEANIIYYPLDDFGNPDYKFIENIKTEIKLIWINYPHMPTGCNLNEEGYSKLITLAKIKKCILVNDNPYSLILNKKPNSLLQFGNINTPILELNSLSKSYNMAGWRIGCLVGNENLIQSVLKVKSNFDSGMYLPIQKASIEALKTLWEWTEQQNKVYEERRKIAWLILEKLNCTFSKNTAGLFVWGKIKNSLTSNEIIDDLLYNYAVFITPGHIFGKDGNKHIRISLCVSKNILLEVLQLIPDKNEK